MLDVVVVLLYLWDIVVTWILLTTNVPGDDGPDGGREVVVHRPLHPASRVLRGCFIFQAPFQS